jgi:hypothetical protein
MLQPGFGRIVTKILDDLSTDVEMSTLVRRDAQSFHQRVKSCALHPESSGGICGPPMIQFVSLERMTVRIRSFHKEYLSCPTRWKNSSENFRAIVEPSKNTQRRMYVCKAWPYSFSGC